MSELVDATDRVEMIGPMATDIVDQKQLAEQLLQQAEEQNIELVGPGGLLNQLTKNVLETALDAEMAEHLGYEKHDPAGHNSGNSRNGTRAKTVLREIGPVEIEVPRDTESTFEPQIVRKRQRRLAGVDEIALSLTARGLTTGEIAAHFQEVYGAKISKDTVSRITEKVTGEMTEWLNRPLEKVYPVIFIDAMVVKVRDGQVANKPVYVVIGVTVDGARDILGLWAGDGGEGAKFWLSVLTEIKNRGVQDVCIAVCDGLKGLPEAITTTWELATVQACVTVCLAGARRPEQDYVLAGVQEVELAEVLDHLLLDAALEGEVELLECLSGGEPGDFDPVLPAVAVADGDLRCEQGLQELLIAPGLLPGPVGQAGKRSGRSGGLQRPEEVRQLRRCAAHAIRAS